MVVKIFRNYILIFLIISIAILIRFYNFENQITYGPEQARSLVVAGRNIANSPSLLGQEYFRYSSDSHRLNYNALFTYSLLPLLIIFKGGVVGITPFFALLNIFTGLVIYCITNKLFSRTTAIFAFIIFLFNNYMIYHSLFLWPYNYLPFLGILSTYLIYLFKQKNKWTYVFLLGLISGIGFGIQYLYSPFVSIVFVLLIYFSKNKIITFLAFLIGAIFGCFPMVIFDLRHNFYYVHTLTQHFIDTIKGNSAGYRYYYLLPLWSLGSVVIGVLLQKFYNKSKYISLLLLTAYLIINLKSDLIDFNKTTGMSIGLTWQKIYKAASVIKQDNPGNFNVVSLLDFDARGYILRYPLEYIFRVKPMGEEEYPKAKELYVFL